MDPWFAKVWKMTGLRGKPPPIYVSKAYVPQAAGWQPNENRNVYISPNVLMGLKQSRQGKRVDLAALQVLLHEMAHVAQPTVLKTRVVEGGADAFAHHNLKRVAQKLYPPNLYGGIDWMSPLNSVLPPPRYRGPYPAYPKYEAGIKPGTRDYGQFGLSSPPPRKKKKRAS
jgi:hypothetical protein